VRDLIKAVAIILGAYTVIMIIPVGLYLLGVGR
jgi:hypothetical protein